MPNGVEIVLVFLALYLNLLFAVGRGEVRRLLLNSLKMLRSQRRLLLLLIVKIVGIVVYFAKFVVSFVFALLLVIISIQNIRLLII